MSAIIRFAKVPTPREAWSTFWTVICWDERAGIETTLDERRSLLASCLKGESVYWRCESPDNSGYANAAHLIPRDAYQQSPGGAEAWAAMGAAMSAQYREDFRRTFALSATPYY